MGKILAFFRPDGRLDGYYHQPDKLKAEKVSKYNSMCEKGYFIEESDIPESPPPGRGKEHFLRLKESPSVVTKGERREITSSSLEWVTVDRPLTQEEAMEIMAEEQAKTNDLLSEILTELRKNGEAAK